MKAFLLSVLLLLAVVIGVHYGLRPLWEVPSGEATTTPNVRLN
jgi:hypothetical protein